ncbi:gamma-aminobutyric acid receptor subunit beta isoform X2 [Nematostella vectensis]|uniref:gamma-aminobutyric acid receptor subunit beta isoform X2 n=1 Tax=Nematostella vectensis TaxID=45351 RepID=UPI002076EA60|nr:gamma-aminobutyric acid receptor subunit beta isoform X2 [Nematostella vectensis]
MWAYLSLLVTFLLCVKFGTCNKALLAYLSSGQYDKTERPGVGTGKPVELGVDIHFDNFGRIEEMNMEVDVFLYMRYNWKDSRLANFTDKTITFTRGDIEKVWRPDTYCSNARESDLPLEETKTHSMLRIDRNGSIYYSRSVHLVAACLMNLRDFPMDIQNCSITLGSYAYSDVDVLYHWISQKEFSVGSRDMAQFYVLGAQPSTNLEFWPAGSYTTLTAHFQMERRIGYFIIQLYLPCVFLVMLSWVVFWMSPENSADRLTVGITTILTIVFLLGYVNGMLPKVSYPKGVDWYLMTSFFFVFMSLVECVVVDRLLLKRKSQEEKKKKKEQDTEENSLAHDNCAIAVNDMTVKNDDTATIESEKPRSRDSKRSSPKPFEAFTKSSIAPTPEKKPLSYFKRGGTKTAIFHKMCGNMTSEHRLDKTCRFLFPVCYLMYNAVYWFVYLSGISILN